MTDSPISDDATEPTGNTADTGGSQRPTSGPRASVVALGAVVAFLATGAIAFAATDSDEGDTDFGDVPLTEVPLYQPAAFVPPQEAERTVVVDEDEPPDGVEPEGAELAAPDLDDTGEPPLTPLPGVASVTDAEVAAFEELDPDHEPSVETDPLTIPIPPTPGPIEPADGDAGEGDVGGSSDVPTEFDPALDPFAEQERRVAGLVDPCAGTSPPADGCEGGIPAAIVPVHSHALVVDDIATDVAQHCRGQITNVPRDSFGIVIRSNRPGEFRVTSTGSMSVDDPQVLTVSTPDDVIADWESAPDAQVETCVLLERESGEWSTFVESHYRVVVEGLLPAAPEPSTASRMIVIHPSGRPEVRITPTGDRTYSVRVPATSSERVIVAVMDQGSVPGDRCSEIDPNTWDWGPAVALRPTEVVPIVQPPPDMETLASPEFEQFWYFDGEVTSGTTQALCVVWIEEFVPSVVATERQSYTLDPPDRPGVSLSVTDIVPADPNPDADEDRVWNPAKGFYFGARSGDDASCASQFINDASLPSSDCAFDLTDPAEARLSYRLQTWYDEAEGQRGNPNSGLFDLTGLSCGAPECAAEYHSEIPGLTGAPVGTAVVQVTITDGGMGGDDWTIRPSGPFQLGGEEPDHPQLNYGTSRLRASPFLPAAQLFLEWEADRPVRAYAVVEASGGGAGDCPPVRATGPGPAGFVRRGVLVFTVHCPRVRYDATITIFDELGNQASFGSNTLEGAGPNFAWPDGTAATAPLPVFVEWEMGVRQARFRTPEEFSDFVPITAEEGWATAPDDDDRVVVEHSIVVDPGESRRVLRTNFRGIPRCLDRDSFDMSSDAPVLVDAGPQMQVGFHSDFFDYRRCFPIRGIAEDVSLARAERAAPDRSGERLFSTTDMVRQGTADFYGKSSGSEAFEVNRFRLRVRPENPAYSEVLATLEP
jgi:hypothetical protein